MPSLSQCSRAKVLYVLDMSGFLQTLESRWVPLGTVGLHILPKHFYCLQLSKEFSFWAFSFYFKPKGEFFGKFELNSFNQNM